MITIAPDFFGLPTRRIGNQCLRLDFLAEAGPRLVRLMRAESDQNLLAEVPNVSWPTPFGEYTLHGGHRLTHAPESARSYVPDDAGLIVEDLPSGGVRLQVLESATHLRKSIEIRLSNDRPRVALHHRLRNESSDPIELAPWAITQLRLGGLVVMPQRALVHDDGLWPDRHLVLWPYTRWQDARWWVDDDYVFVTAQPAATPLKVGSLNGGWLGYLIGDVFFLKRFEPHLDRLHPDRNCNAEVYSSQRFVELESLAPLSSLLPGQAIEHVETWEIYSPCDVPQTSEGARAVIEALNLSTPT